MAGERRRHRPRRRSRVGRRRRGRRKDGLGRGRHGRALLPVPLLRAAHRHGAPAGNRTCTDHRRLPDDHRSERGGEPAEPGGDRATERKFAGIDFHDLAIGLSAALTIMIMPFAFSITDGIGFGFIAYVLIRIAQVSDGSTPSCWWPWPGSRSISSSRSSRATSTGSSRL